MQLESHSQQVYNTEILTLSCPCALPSGTSASQTHRSPFEMFPTSVLGFVSLMSEW